MDYTGEVYEQVESLVGLLSVNAGPKYYECKLEVGGVSVLEYLLPNTVDSNAIVSRTQNIINQTGVIKSGVRVVLTEVT